ncbi:MAG: NADH-quinone oxidoreductase subunit J [Actinobacteria bacterium]|nr:NADH-quinone oxidoreductase subunit J [Actinomycetota bacterium]
MSLILILLIILIVAALMVVFSSRLLIGAISLALTSIMITILMFKLNSPLAAVFELSICAGLITVIFITTISFVKPQTEEELIESRKRRIKKYIYLPVLVALVGYLVSVVIKPISLKLPEIIQETSVRNVLWDLRQVDLLGQAIVLLIGVFGIVVLFKEGRKK